MYKLVDVYRVAYHGGACLVIVEKIGESGYISPQPVNQLM